ncbi:STAS domain-containing protein [Priestia megaterium]|jgi:rsbT co-antagonist protein RsbR|uniref:STAS domain protein n=1 Tax=Priestia megaterium (strain ATCC 14581 / DSM 32 / CCUG 1817 / JCM 2506 / NBRC 15308 / NCIMB 9376 / NCTC 10342 / NRRL B-14308 / VKM B-512 / Ford 19) TaxID=1348623 RepID=A0A0B6AYP2_PRIM2|nr:STAS domain-containing protein [Priestia megaterium]AJI25034.1 STAS domain protein [Priestia megaterium NBRC 15308 = ATCC 14581]KFM96163.1 STAS domain protein [Priestia megaterium]KGJ79887.1 anti-sigma factor antagonist [Priestia megaterium NBRC 15308 = ATCC 14581]MDR4232723.1 STAS domain-containing protein [Priestia megaterium]MED3810494.1 STAS domain-containing protein [Priestia megaterium]
MEIIYNSREKMTDFIKDNRQNFQDKLLSEAVNVASKINDILETGNIDLLKNAQKLSLYVVEQKEEQLVAFAQQEGVAWAEHSLTLAFKLEWVQSIRRTLWHFLYQYDRINNLFNSREEFYALEKQINDRIDQFLNTFLISYSKYKDELIASQRELVEHLSVPVIPLSQSIAVLPLIGMIDTYRIQTIEEKVLTAISDLKIQTLIIDLSGAANMEMHVIDHFQKVLTGISMMGCKAILTGLRADLVRTMIHSGISFEEKAETKGTLQQTLKEYLELHQI